MNFYKISQNKNIGANDSAPEVVTEKQLCHKRREKSSPITKKKSIKGRRKSPNGVTYFV